MIEGSVWLLGSKDGLGVKISSLKLGFGTYPDCCILSLCKQTIRVNDDGYMG